MLKNWLTYILGAAAVKLEGPIRSSASAIKDHVIIGKSMQGYMTGQKLASQRPVYRAQYRSRSKYMPHQGAQECARRVAQGW